MIILLWRVSGERFAAVAKLLGGALSFVVFARACYNTVLVSAKKTCFHQYANINGLAADD